MNKRHRVQVISKVEDHLQNNLKRYEMLGKIRIWGKKRKVLDRERERGERMMGGGWEAGVKFYNSKFERNQRGRILDIKNG